MFGPEAFAAADLRSAGSSESARMSTSPEELDSLSPYSDEGKKMMAMRLASEAMTLPEVRLDKVAIVQSALANGSYRVRAAELALKVMDTMVESESAVK